MVDLPPEIEAQLAACATRNGATAVQLRALQSSVDELVDTLDGDGPLIEGDAIPEEAFDDPSVVRHIGEAEVVAHRVRRISTPQPATVHRAVLRMGGVGRRG